MGKHTIQSLLGQHLKTILSSKKYPLHQLKSLTQLSKCRTAALGGHAQYCENGHLNGVWYNSCKNRSCPQCRGLASEEWLLNTKSMLLDCPHHHIVFTFSSELNDVWRFNRGIFGDILFKAAHETLKKFSQDKQYLGATPGMLSTLHTWGRSLSLHPHIHVLMTHGGMDKAGNWVSPAREILFPQKPVRIVYRAKLRSYLLKAIEADELVIPPDRRKHQLIALINKLGRKESIVHFCKRYDYGEGVAKYLARYVKRGPVNNSQLIHVDENNVVFQYKSHKTKRVERIRLTVDAFVERFAQHIPLRGKASVRYTGLYAPAKREVLNVARAIHRQKPVTEREQVEWMDYMEKWGGAPKCKDCGKQLNVKKSLDTVKNAA